ncbi:MAG: ABC transporter ATP-binding protein, partial [Bauldia sp.]|nr:ABC transporter ATP-binding protein [Bauldia sp.]
MRPSGRILPFAAMARSGPPAASGVPALFRRFSPYLRPVRGPVAGVAALLLAAPLIAAALIWLIKILVDEVLIGGGLGLLPLLGAAYVLAAAGRAGLGYVTTRLDASVGERITRDIRVDLYRHAISVSPGSLPDRGPGDRLAHLSGDVERTQALIYKAPLSLFADLAAAALFMALLLLLDWLLTLAALLAVPLLALASARNAPRLRRAARIARRLTSRWFALAEERLGATPLVHAYGTHGIETARFAARCEESRRAELRTVSIEAWLALLIESATALGGLLVLGVGAWRIAEGSLTVGALVAFLGAVGSLYSPVKGLARAAGRFQRAAAGAQRVSDLLDRPSLVRERPAARPLAPVRGAVEFRNVSFRY